jgi:deoxyribodipyrimidine photo-lyase
MRQLRREGWMHNRARMVTASFLTRRLGIEWQRGAEHYMRWLVDGDPANNSGGWQWVAGTGTDPRRSRSFNPVRQAERFDPDGAYVRRYVRELADVPAARIFAPWWDPELLRATGYPAPIIEVPSSKPPGPGVTPLRVNEPAHPG